MKNKPLVSVIIIFLNTAQFLQEAIESVLAQTYDNWELLLVDDGSTDGSTVIAQSYAACYPQNVRYLEHEGHQNLGKSISRNLGITTARGEYIAFLDADDVWLPQKLEMQVAILDAQPAAAMVYGLSQWWYSWTGRPEDENLDFVYDLGVEPNVLVYPPELFSRFFVRQTATIPCPSGVLVRQTAIARVGGFEESFQGIYDVYEDQTFFAKLSLHEPIFVSNSCWEKYRQHPASSSVRVEQAGKAFATRRFFLKWLLGYVAEQGLRGSDLWYNLQVQLWTHRHPLLHRLLFAMKAPGMTVRSLFVDRARQTSLHRTPHWVLKLWQLYKEWPPVGWVRFGNLRRVEPFSRDWGFDRGQPIDRYYIERFLAYHTHDIQGRVLEVADNIYTRRFGGGRVILSDVLDVSADNPKATVVADLAAADHLVADTYDCVILTQTLQLIYEVPVVLQTLYRTLKPGGVLLVTIPGISQISRYDMDRWGHYWSFTTRSARRLFETVFPAANVEVTAHGNVLAASAFLYGLAAEELSRQELDHCDPDYEVIITVRAVKPEARRQKEELPDHQRATERKVE